MELDSPQLLAAARAAIARDGLFMLQDPVLPCLAHLVAGEKVRGSWWGHPAGEAIFAVASALYDERDVATVKLVAEKVTFVHRRLWPAMVSIGRAREKWQTDALPASARALLERVESEREVELGGASADGKLLVARLLVYGTQRHTVAGRHANVLRSWKQFVAERDVKGRLPTPVAAREELETAVANWAGAERKRAPLPCQSKRR
ncbi:MAG: hypothetical protein HOW73_40315 [Polyangiaceae bacterium]|nr:hypothetical protein [Polyangiaceae bacterium]